MNLNKFTRDDSVSLFNFLSTSTGQLLISEIRRTMPRPIPYPRDGVPVTETEIISSAAIRQGWEDCWDFIIDLAEERNKVAPPEFKQVDMY